MFFQHTAGGLAFAVFLPFIHFWVTVFLAQPHRLSRRKETGGRKKISFHGLAGASRHGTCIGNGNISKWGELVKANRSNPACFFFLTRIE